MSVDPFSDVVGHEAVKRLLERALERPHHAYLFIGGEGLGAHALAERFARELLQASPDQPFSSHPDAALLVREIGESVKSTIAVEAVRDLRSRMARRPVMAPRMVAYLPEADRLNDAGANALLKSMEEPSAGAVFILVAQDESRLPATIRSRSAVIRLSPVASREIDAWLTARGVAKGEREEAVRQADGHPGRALHWIEDADARVFAAEASRTTDALLSAASPAEAIALLDPHARRADTADDTQQAWQQLLDGLMRALRERFAEHPAASLHLGQALARARTRVGGPVSPRVWVELVLAEKES